MYVEFYHGGCFVVTDKDSNILISSNRKDKEYVPNETSLLSKSEMKDSILSAIETDGTERLLKRIFFPGVFPDVLEHILIGLGLNKNSLVNELQEVDKIVEEISDLIEGVYKDTIKIIPSLIMNKKETLAYRIFPLRQDEGFEVKPYETFNKAMDSVFSGQEKDRADKETEKNSGRVDKRLNKVKKQQQMKMDEHRKNISALSIKITLLEENEEIAAKCLELSYFCFLAEFSSEYLDRITEEEKRKGHPLAIAIKKMNRKDRTLTIAFNETEIVLDSRIGFNANRNEYYEKRKKVALKLEKTIQAQGKALKAAEKKIRRTEKDDVVKKAQNIRKRFSFEKFNWFITSDRELVISGRDATQNEIIVKRHLERDDIYSHSEMGGSASAVVKKRQDRNKVTLSSIYEAGIMSIVHGKAWKAKIPTSAWWVYPSQVSKTAPSGQSLGTGSFVIRGKKNFLPPTKLEYGIGILFYIDRIILPTINSEPQIWQEKFKDLIEEWSEENPIEDGNTLLNGGCEELTQGDRLNVNNELNVNNISGEKDSVESIVKSLEEAHIGNIREKSISKHTEIISKMQLEGGGMKNPIHEGNKLIINNDVPGIEAIDRLTGEPKNEDNIHFALPMCGPITALSNFTYRLTLVPGGMKKGEAAREIRKEFIQMIEKRKKEDPDQFHIYDEHLRHIKEIDEVNFVDYVLSDTAIKLENKDKKENKYKVKGNPNSKKGGKQKVKSKKK
eukprot:GHVP01052376.1.p1 GENE.GHVP01052376.1~~GHVP01052376.1.p1  ORF type:complete len:849 (+),score=195.15 GHVP01052376.1:362-2548(+)